MRTKRTLLRQPSGIRDNGANLEMTELSLSPTHEDEKNLPTRAGGWPTFLPGKTPHTNHKPVYPSLHGLNDEVDLWGLLDEIFFVFIFSRHRRSIFFRQIFIASCAAFQWTCCWCYPSVISDQRCIQISKIILQLRVPFYSITLSWDKNSWYENRSDHRHAAAAAAIRRGK